jgi:alanine racemase
MTANHPVAQIHLDHISENFALAGRLAPNQKRMAVIKANAYGHGVTEVAACLGAADAFAVARVDEAIQLRGSQPDKPIVILEGYLDEAETNACSEFNLTPVIHSDYQFPMLSDTLPFWLKFNTGMFRLGFGTEQSGRLAKLVAKKNLQGLMTHFANADNPTHELNALQIQQFDVCCADFPDAPRSAGNSGVVMQFNQALVDWVRPGLMIYGGGPAGIPLENLKPGMTLSAPVIAINHLKSGDAIGYGSTWRADKDCRIAIVALGYADGYPRETPAGTPVLVNGERRTLVGRVAMDMVTVLLEEQDTVTPGDHVVFWGEGLPIDEVAASAGTISYTLMTCLGSRVKRVFNDQ